MSIVHNIRRRCSQGFTLGQKAVITLVAVVYVISPIDLAPDLIPVLGQMDDLTVLVLLFKVWVSPTNPPASGGSLPA